MAIKINFDPTGNPESPTLVLANKNGNKIGHLTNINNVVFKGSLVNVNEFTFKAYKTFDNNVLQYWDELTDFKLIWVPEWDRWFQISVELNQENETIKNVNATSLGESELSQIMLYNIEINTETDISRDDYKIPTIFYNPDHPEASLINRLMEKAPHYSIKHIDISLMNIQRTYTFDDISIYDAFHEISEEMHCLFVFDCGSNPDGTIARNISVYDLETNCSDCGYRDIYVDKCPKCGSKNIIEGYGQDTTIFISRENLADEITYSTDVDSVKNCFKLEAGDDLMTAAIRSCNPNGTDYIWYFSDEMKIDMSEELRSKIIEYDEMYSYYQTTYSIALPSSFVSQYNTLINKYSSYNNDLKAVNNPIIGYPNLMNVYFDTIDMALFLEAKLMPNIDKPVYTAQNQADFLLECLTSLATTSTKNMSVSTANNIVLSFASAVVYSSYKVSIANSSLSGTVWTGSFKITNYSDEEDTYTTRNVSVSINDSYNDYTKQRLEKILYKEDKNNYDIVGLFKLDISAFKSELRKYCLDSLNTFYKCCQSCLDIMIQQGIPENPEDNSVIYNDLYLPYYNKLNAIQDEINVRDSEIQVIEGKYNASGKLLEEGFQTAIEKVKTDIQKKLNFETYLGNKLWLEFSSFKREDKYKNTNFISDGLSNTELFNNALEFIKTATKEIYKSANYQHSIESTLKNLLVMKEFRPLLNMFEVGNWLRIEIDNQVYKLRLIEYNIDFENPDDISVVFSDVEKVNNVFPGIQDLLNKTNSMGTSYDSLLKQSEINSDTTRRYNDMIKKGLSMTNMKIVSDPENQRITWDEHGLLCREYNDILDDYNPCQLKIINHGMYLTDDNWRTARCGVGKFIYYDPKDGLYKEGYGVIADTLCSNLILSNEVGIYNDEKSIELSKNGIVVTTNTYNKNVFTIQRELTDNEGNKYYEKQLYIDDNGNIVLGGNAKITWSNIIDGDETVNNVLNNFINGEFKDTIDDLKTQTDQKAETWYQANDPSIAWETTEQKSEHIGDMWYNTNDKKSYRWDGNKWVIMDIEPPQEVYDKIDGKAQIFVNTPIPPYDVGDLWFNSKTSDIMTCVTKRDSGNYVASDWEKRNKYTDDTTANNALSSVNNLANDYNKLKEILGYNGTTITGTYIYSPHIIGGDISIGNKESGVMAQITSDGKLTATGAEISGDIIANSLTLGSGVTIGASKVSGLSSVATSGKFSDLVGAPDLSMYISKDGVIGSNPTEGATGFTVSSRGLLQASNAIIYGTIYASNGSIAGWTISGSAIYKNSSIWGTANGMYFGTNGLSISDKFKVDSNGNLTASNAKISGTISSSEINNGAFYVDSSGNLTATSAKITGEINAISGSFGGFIVASTSNENEHMYANTLYTIVNGSDGYDYQVGIKGNSANNDATEAAFYVRRKSHSVNYWSNSTSTVPFYVRKNGTVYCENLRIGNNLYMNVATYNGIDNWELSRRCAIQSGLNSISFGMVNSGASISCNGSGIVMSINESTILDIINTSNSVIKITPGIDFNKVNIGDEGEAFSALYADKICKGDGTPVSWSGHVHAGLIREGKRKVALNSEATTLRTYADDASSTVETGKVDLGSANSHFKTLYIDEIVLGGNAAISNWNIKGTETGGLAGFTLNYKLGGNSKTVTINSETTTASLGNFAAYSHTHSNLPDITSMGTYDSSNGVKIAVNNSMIMHNNRGYNCYDTSGKEQTMMYISDANRALFGNNNIPTIIRGKSTIYLGNNGNTDVRVGVEMSGSTIVNEGSRVLSTADLLKTTGDSEIQTMSQKAITEAIGKSGGGGGIINATASATSVSSYYSASASVTVNGNTANFSFSIPRGEKGEKGDKGDTGSPGAKGEKGDPGSSTPSQVTASDGTARPPITTGTGATQKVAYITANNTDKLKVQAQFGNSSYSGLYVALTSSDIRLKCNIKNTTTNGLSLINSIRMHEFNWIKDNRYQKIGFIADELEMLDDSLVFGGGYDEDGTMDLKSINSFYLQGYEIKAIQELSEIKDKQAGEIMSLKSQLQQTQNDLLNLQGELAILKMKMEEQLC